MKKCPNCNNEFEPVNYRGVEQIYCSRKCRTKQGNIRHQQKIRNEFSGEIINGNIDKNEVLSHNNYRREANTFNGIQSISDTNVFQYIEQCYEARTEALRMELKYEKAIEDLNLLKTELNALKYEQEQNEEPEQREGIAGFLDNIPDWLSPAIGKLLQHEKVQNFIISQIPAQNEEVA